jgi:hypothetical protein
VSDNDVVAVDDLPESLDEVRAIVRASRRAQGLPETLEDADIVTKCVAIVRAVVVEPRNGRRADGNLGAGHGKDLEIEWVKWLRGG